MIRDPLLFFRNALSHGKDVTLDFVGDSITWGLNHCTAEETFVAHFARLFASRFPKYEVVRYDGIAESEALPISRFEGPIPVGGEGRKSLAVIVRNGVGGNTVRRAIARKENFLGAMPNGKVAEITFLMFGINDALACDKSKYVTPELFEKDYEELLDYLECVPTLPIVISPTYNGEKYPLEKYAAVSKRVALRRGLPYLDAHKLWSDHYRKGAPRFGQGDWLSESKTDACHFSPEGSYQTAKFLLDAFCALLCEK